jgi:hypothetical protein
MTGQVRMPALAALLLLSAASAEAEPDALFPPGIAGCYVGDEITPVAAGAPPYRKPAVPVSGVRLERGYPQLMHEEQRKRPAGGNRLINLRVIVTFADAGKPGAPKRYANGPNDLLSCSAEVCDANNYRVERLADGAVLLRMTGGLYVGGGTELNYATRHLPDGHVYRLVAGPASACY